MKKKILALACLVASAFTAGADAVLTVNGSEVQKAVATLTFDGDNVTVTYADNSTSSHDMEAVSLSFSPSSSLETLRFSELKVTVGSQLEVAGVAEGCLLQVFDIRGRLAVQARSAGSECAMDISALEPGVYLLRAGNEIVKFVKR